MRNAKVNSGFCSNARPAHYGFLVSAPEQRTDGLNGLRDPYVARALAVIHERPEHAWSLDDLARQAGLSRSAFSERFVRQVRVSPMRYLSRLRLCQAADRLKESNEPISTIAFAAGYESEASFTRAFKREFGISPGVFRQAGPRSDGRRQRG